MLRVFETFSGIGAQAKALERCKEQYGYDFEIFATAEWDVNAIIAYDLIHNGEQDLSEYENMTKDELVEALSKYSLSPDGKEPYKDGCLKRNPEIMLKQLLCAINRTHNLVSVTDIKGMDLPDDIDVLTYSFPCQNLSIASVIHGIEYMSGINKGVKNRSGMLWEIERILKEMAEGGKQLPKFLLMENVTTLFSDRHIKDFESWQHFLEDIGYFNITYRKLRGSDFNSPQARDRSFMLSVYLGKNKDLDKVMKLNAYLDNHRLDSAMDYIKSMDLPCTSVDEILKDDYSVKKYKDEAEASLLTLSPSRLDIINENEKILIYENGQKKCPLTIHTITTKQDRNPTTGLIEYPDNTRDDKYPYRYMTPRECFLGMGFDEKDFDSIIDHNFLVQRNTMFFTRSKMERMAGNSIVVNVLQALFKQIYDITEILEE